jgi:hypothetical protein
LNVTAGSYVVKVVKLNDAGAEVPAGFEAVIVIVYPLEWVRPVNITGLEFIIGAAYGEGSGLIVYVYVTPVALLSVQ